MPYRITETPDHIHRGLAVFAAANLKTVLDWLEVLVESSTLHEEKLSPEDRWLLDAVKERGLTRGSSKQRLLATKNAQDFLRKHPEFRKGSTYQTSTYPDRAIDFDTNAAREDWRDYLEFEFHQDIHGDQHIAHAIDNLRSALRSKTISTVVDEIESTHEVLVESGFRHRFALEALEVLHELLIGGARDRSRYLDQDSECAEAYEVTGYCNGHFRELARSDIERIRKLTPTGFEHLCAELLGQFGLSDIHLTRIVADGGVDIVGYQVLDGRRIKYVVQCKRYALRNRVDVRVVRELAGVKMDSRADRAIVITTSEMTKPAREFSSRTRNDVWGVRLIDHNLLRRLLDCVN